MIVLSVAGAACAALALPARSSAAALSVKLPYAKGESFVVTQGYNSPPTHIKKDAYAIDLTQNGCAAYGLSAVAAASGTAMFVSQEGYNGGYGTEIIVSHGGAIVSRYAHLIPDSITVATGTPIRQGQMIGRIGDTGLVAGAACAAHPGTHIHFAMDTVNADGTFSAYDPEPISGYTDITEGKWYLSDNGDDEAGAATTVLLPPSSTPPSALAMTTSTVVATTTAIAAPVNGAIVPNSGFTTVSPGISVAQVPSTTLEMTITVTTTTAATSSDENDAVATSTPTDDATSTVSGDATGTQETTPSSTILAASSSDILFEQLGDDVQSTQSYYSDNWFELGNGYSGTLTAITLEGAENSPDYLAGQITLQEFKDKNYSAEVEEFPISENAPFTFTMATATFNGLSILLKPYFYYRISTLQDRSLISMILAGTATTTTGTEMWANRMAYVGREEFTAPFFPFMIMEGAPATSTLTPPPLTVPSNIAETFDEINMQLNVSWSTSTDPDWPANPLRYQLDYSTSTTLSDSGWTDPGPIPLAMGNTYLIGVRALDGYGAISAVATATWNFPAGFSPYLLSPELSYAYQYFTVSVTSTLKTIGLFTANVRAASQHPDWSSCSLSLFDEYSLSSLGMIADDSDLGGYSCAGDPIFSFASSSFVLYPGHTYHWVFSGDGGALSVQFYGAAADTAGGTFSDPSLANAKFTVTGDTGVLFSN